MYNSGISEETEMEVLYRSGGQCECRSEKHRFHPNGRCPNSIGDSTYRFVWHRTPTVNNTRVICYFCYRFCYSRHLRQKRSIRHRKSF